MENKKEPKIEKIYLLDIKDNQYIDDSNSILIENNEWEPNFLEEFNDIPGIKKTKKSSSKYFKNEILTLISYSGFLILFFNIFKSYWELMLILSFFNFLLILIFFFNKIKNIGFVNITEFIFLVIFFDLCYYLLFMNFSKENFLEKIMMVSFDIIFILYYNTYNNINTKYEIFLIIIPILWFISSIILIVLSYEFSYNLLSCILFLFVKPYYNLKKKIFLKNRFYNTITFLFYFFLVNFLFINIILIVRSIIYLDLKNYFLMYYYPLFNKNIFEYFFLSVLYLIYYTNSIHIFKNNYKSILFIQPLTPIFSLFWGVLLSMVDQEFFNAKFLLVFFILILQSLGNSIIYNLIDNLNKNIIFIKRMNSNKETLKSFNFLINYE